MRTGPTRSTSPACFLARLRRDFRAVYLAGLLCCAMLLPACLLVWLGVYLRVFWLSLAGGAAGGLLGAQGVCGLFDTLLRSRRGRLGAWWPGYCAAFRQNARDALLPGAVAGGALGAWVWVLMTLPLMERVPNSVWLCMFFGGACVIGFFLDLFAQLVLVDLPLGGLLKHTEMLFLGFLLRTLAAALVVLLYWMALVLFFPYALPLLLITGGWLPGVLAVQILYPALDQAYGLTQRDADIEQEKR